MNEGHNGKRSLFDLLDNSTMRVLAAAAMVGVAWNKLNSVEASIKALSEQFSAYGKAQEEKFSAYTKTQADLTVSEKLLEARVLSLETNQPKNGSKHQ